MAQTKEITPTKVGTPAEMISQAIAGGADLEKLEKLLGLQERWDKNEAQKAYHRSMTAFKSNPPEIEKDKKVSYGTTKYNHASLANVTRKINNELSKHGLSASWRVSQNGLITVTCKITHEQGHSEETSMSAPSDTSGQKNAIQSIGSTITYLERYTLLALTGLATSEMDTDGGSTEKISKDEENAIMDAMLAKGINDAQFLAYMKVEKLADIPKSDFTKAMTAIQAKKK